AYLAPAASVRDDRDDRRQREGPGGGTPSPRSPRVDAYDNAVVARDVCVGPVPGGARRGWTIFGRFSAFAMTAGRSCTCAGGATGGRSTARPSAEIGSERRPGVRPSSATGGASTAGAPRRAGCATCVWAA